MTKAAQRQAHVKVQGIDGLWAQRSGGETTSETTKVFDGGALSPDVLSSPPMTDNIVISRPFDRTRDSRLARNLRAQVESLRRTVSVTYTDEALIASGDDVVHPDALLVRLAEPEVDAESGDAMRLELEFAVGQVR